METKKVQLKEKVVEVRELLAVESDEIMDMDLVKTSDRIRERIKKMASLTDDDYSVLTEKERDLIIAAMSEVNGWDFQVPKQKSD